MTRHGHINGQKGRRGNQHKPTPAPGTEAMDAARADAVTYLERTGNSDLLPILGLVADPVAERARRAKALVDMGSKPWSQRAAGPDWLSRGSMPLVIFTPRVSRMWTQVPVQPEDLALVQLA